MARSSSIPTSQPLSGITRIVRTRTRSVTISRPTTTTNALDDIEKTLSEHTEDMWIYEPRESVGQEFAGERINGSLGALVVADRAVDLQKDDRLVHGGVEYEIDTIVGHPEDTEPDGTVSPNTKFFVIDFVRRQ